MYIATKNVIMYNACDYLLHNVLRNVINSKEEAQ